MTPSTEVLIAIQARSSSKRLPNKCMLPIDGKPIIRHVLDACRKSERFLNEKTMMSGIKVRTVVLVPTGDPLKDAIRHWCDDVIEGDEHDVLSRYKLAYEKFKPAFLVRITADCPLMSSNLISKHVKLASQYSLHYCSNVDEKYRTYFDGGDVEVISAKAFEWVLENAKTKSHKEHVTIILRENPPAFLTGRIGHVMGFLDLSGLKLSVDTQDDYERVRAQFESLTSKVYKANNDSTHPKVFRF